MEEILLPGERSDQTALRDREERIAIGEDIFKEFKSLCAELGVSLKLD